jgi:hypothetical protein
MVDLICTTTTSSRGWATSPNCGGLIEDVEVMPPSLEDIYSHFSRRARNDPHPGRRHRRVPHRAAQPLGRHRGRDDGALLAGAVGGRQRPHRALGVDRLSVTVASLTSLAVYLVPLVALLMSFDAIAGEVERGTLPLVLTYPVSPRPRSWLGQVRRPSRHPGAGVASATASPRGRLVDRPGGGAGLAGAVPAVLDLAAAGRHLPSPSAMRSRRFARRPGAAAGLAIGSGW